MLSLAPGVYAVSDATAVFYEEIDLGDGVTVVDEIFASPQTRSSTKDYTWKRTYYYSSDKIAEIAVWGEFSYNGSTVSVVDKEVTQATTYNGWSFSQSSFTSSGGTIALSGKLTKFLSTSVSVSMTLSCDKNGNISYT